MGNTTTKININKSRCTITVYTKVNIKDYNHNFQDMLTDMLTQDQREKIVNFILESKTGKEMIRTEYKHFGEEYTAYGVDGLNPPTLIRYHGAPHVRVSTILEFSIGNDFCYPYIEHILNLEKPERVYRDIHGFKRTPQKMLDPRKPGYISLLQKMKDLGLANYNGDCRDSIKHMNYKQFTGVVALYNLHRIDVIVSAVCYNNDSILEKLGEDPENRDKILRIMSTKKMNNFQKKVKIKQGVRGVKYKEMVRGVIWWEEKDLEYSQYSSPVINRWIMEKISAEEPCLFLATDNPELTTFMLENGADINEKIKENKEENFSQYLFDICSSEVKTLYIENGFIHKCIVDLKQEKWRVNERLIHQRKMNKMIKKYIPDDVLVDISGEIIDNNVLDVPLDLTENLLIEVTDE